MRKKPPLEKEIQKQIIDYLRIKRWVVIKFNNVGIFKQETKKYIPPSQKGIADLSVCSPQGRFIAIEVKREKGIVTEDQKAFGEEIEARHGIYLVARSIDDIIKFVDHYEKYGIPDKKKDLSTGIA